MRCEFHPAIDHIAANLWDALNVTRSPFLRHAFLSEAERCGAVSPELGWYPAHLTLHDDSGLLIGAQPLYLRTLSFGDFSHDWAWARACQQLGKDYYPKLVCGVPYTPASGARQLIHPAAERASISRALTDATLQLAAHEQASSVQYLYLDDDATLRTTLAAQDFLLRRGCQFHWHNAGYASFDDFLATFNADRRKKVKREQRRVSDAGLRIEVRHGGDIDAALWQAIYPHYVATFVRFGNHPAFSIDFFINVGRRLGRQLVVFLARDVTGKVVAAAICYRSHDTLYGRHWGADADYHSLHFALCFYSGIDYCIREGLQHFEPGAQGEHKVSRGFEPTATCSAFHISDPRLRGMIGNFLQREQQAVQQYQDEMAEHLPYRKTE